jgi:hypothetical protein
MCPQQALCKKENCAAAAVAKEMNRQVPQLFIEIVSCDGGDTAAKERFCNGALQNYHLDITAPCSPLLVFQ